MHVPLNDTIYFDITTHNSGALLDADLTPTWQIFESSGVTPIQSGDFTKRDTGNYYGSCLISNGNGFDVGNYYSVIGKAVVNSVTSKTVVHNFKCTKEETIVGVPPVDVIAVSGEPITMTDSVDANIIEVSGEPVAINDFKYSDTSIYFADISHIHDGINNQDEYTVQWFKDSQPLSSGDISNPAFSVYNTSDGSAVLNNVVMQYASTTLGVVRYNETSSILASGEPYLVTTSGTIDSQTRTWKSIVGFNVI